jgi:hypothetical protein
MRGLKPAMGSLLAATGVAVALVVAPAALADPSCDPTATVCQGEVQVGTGSPSVAPSPMVSDDQYPYDDDWYFNPAGGGTEMQPEHPSGGGAPGGGGHR